LVEALVQKLTVRVGATKVLSNKGFWLLNTTKEFVTFKPYIDQSMEAFGIFEPDNSDNCVKHLWAVHGGTQILLGLSASEQLREFDECFMKTNPPNYEGRKQYAYKYLTAKFTDLCSALARACNKDAKFVQSDTYLVATVVLRDAMDHRASLCTVHNKLLGRFVDVVEVAWQNPCERPEFEENRLGVLLKEVRKHVHLLDSATSCRFEYEQNVHGKDGKETVSQLCERESLCVRALSNLLKKVQRECVSFWKTDEYQEAIQALISVRACPENSILPPARTICVCGGHGKAMDPLRGTQSPANSQFSASQKNATFYTDHF
jgi:hypothetical protein